MKQARVTLERDVFLQEQDFEPWDVFEQAFTGYVNRKDQRLGLIKARHFRLMITGKVRQQRKERVDADT